MTDLPDASTGAEKRCTKCGQPKHSDEFHRDKSKPDGHAPVCKSCKTAYDLARYPQVRDKKIASAVKWYRENTEKKLDYDAERRANGGHKTRLKRCPACGKKTLMRPDTEFCSVKCRGFVRYNECPTYSGMHQRLSSLKGSAAAYACVDCGSSADDWSYDGLDPDELTDARLGLKYSLFPGHYAARCKPCHCKHDRVM
jgi:NAD-dependent SIR2 family protein deacetylase